MAAIVATMERRRRWKFLSKLQLLFALLATALVACNFRYASLAIQGAGEGGDCLRSSAESGGIGELPPRLPPPASKASSPSLDFNFTIAICAIVLDMDAYLAEWLDYHLGAMGIDGVVLYDHSPEFHLRSWALSARDHPLYHKVRVVHWTQEWFPQGEAYRDCVARFGRDAAEPGYERIDMVKRIKRMYKRRVVRTLGIREGYDYLAFIDGDEFLVPKGKYTSVHGVVRDYLAPYGGALVVNWMLFGSANRTLYSPVPVLRRFQYRDAEANPVVKTIVKASDFRALRNPHAVALADGKLVRTTSRPGAVHAEQFPNASPNASKTGATDSALPSSVLLLHHYRYLSAGEYDDKNCRRGHVDGKNVCGKGTGRSLTGAELRARERPSHLAVRPGEVRDGSAWRFLVDRVPRYGAFDDPAWDDPA